MHDTALSKQQEALHHYLDSLLAEIPPLVDEAAAPATVSEPGGLPSEEMGRPAAGARQAPAWRLQPFKALLFRLDGMEVAAPLVQLAGVATGGHVRHVPGLPAWCGGLLLHRDRQVCIVDPARILAAGGQGQPGGQVEARRYVLFDQGRYALPCEAVREVTEVPPEVVRWRQGTCGRARPWYGGIIMESMCVLLDLAALARMLADEQDMA